MSPPLAFARGMRIAFLIGIAMVNAMRGNPENGAAFQGESCADGESVLKPFGDFVSAMSEEAVIAHANSQASRNPPQKQGDEEGLPREKEKGDDGADVEKGHEESGDPIDLTFARLGFPKNIEFNGHG